MTKKRVTLGIVSMGLFAVVAAGCHAEARFGTPEVKAATPPPPPEPTPPPPPEPVKAAEPPPAPKLLGRVSVHGNKIEITEQIQFDKGGANINKESFGLLDEVAKTIKDGGDKIKKLEVAGHTSAEGDAGANMKLSQDRAASVMKALVERGVDKTKLTSKGYGITKPIGDNSDAGGRVKNRRVEFTISDK
jgi:outer membrane protein OmpA-like peptidoglycan-associated protein